MPKEQMNQPATGFGMQASAGPLDVTVSGTVKPDDRAAFARPDVVRNAGYGMERNANAGSEMTGAYESQFTAHMNVHDAVTNAALHIERHAESQLGRIVDALVDIMNPEYRSRAFFLTSSASLPAASQPQQVWEVPLEGQWTLDRVQLLTADGSSYPDYVKIDVPEVGTPLYLTSALTFIEPRLLVNGSQRVTINAVSATSKNGVLLITFRRVLHIARRRQWQGEF